MTDGLVHWVRTQQDANVPLVQLQDPTVTRGPGLLVVTDDQRVALWAAANREHDRLTRGAWWEKGWAKAAVASVIMSSMVGGAASIVALVVHR